MNFTPGAIINASLSEWNRRLDLFLRWYIKYYKINILDCFKCPIEKHFFSPDQTFFYNKDFNVWLCLFIGCAYAFADRTYALRYMYPTKHKKHSIKPGLPMDDVVPFISV